MLSLAKFFVFDCVFRAEHFEMLNSSMKKDLEGKIRHLGAENKKI